MHTQDFKMFWRGDGFIAVSPPNPEWAEDMCAHIDDILNEYPPIKSAKEIEIEDIIQDYLREE